MTTNDVEECPRCGGKHLVLAAFKFQEAPDFELGQYTHWSVCPITGEPILVPSNLVIDD